MASLIKILGNAKIIGSALIQVADWILATNRWNDDGVWKDVSVWKD